MTRLVFILLCTLLTLPAMAQNCLKLSGIIQDLTTRQPVSASLYVLVPGGSIHAGKSDENGRFTVDVNCNATALIIEHPNYRSQRLLVKPTLTMPASEAVAITVPMIPNSFQQVSVRPLTSAEFKLLSPKVNPKSKQRSLFFMSDVYTTAPVRARTCFHYMTADWTNCLDPDVEGRFELAFAEKDELTVEVKSPGFDFYQGMLTIDAANGRLRHDYRLFRDLVSFSVRVQNANGTPVTETFRCEIRPVAAGAPPVTLNAGRTWQSSYLFFPQAYRLALVDARKQIRHQQDVVLREGFNMLEIKLPPVAETPKPTPPAPTVTATVKPASPATPPVSDEPAVTFEIPGVAALNLPDSIPPIYFRQSSYELMPESAQVLRAVAAYLKKNPKYQVKVMGHTDNVGDPAKNQTLSQYRAMVTATFLRRLDVTDERLTTTGFGSRYPMAPNDTEENKAKNRRVTLKLTGK
ncbi:OmpA family protein [Arsenicibacter rosenii]|uniref:OmpA-like domain-containing protein n=1 Tax=Arsenicibacter rosenii TaxID=1750698 RepID=A0A1S2VKS2_9BACT|nr:OmpA family protein [Arsenicibacter rosenii]OIN58815.1 hypothetical protein BLX24_11310 [Arsenicibacter rosenii]